MSDFVTDFAWQRQFLPKVKKALAETLIVEAPFEEDANRNTDMMVLHARNLRISCRIRKYADLKYSDEFTIREGRPTGTKTELTKIIEGWGDYMFYGFAAESGPELSAWILGDLTVFRGWFMRKLSKLNAGELPGIQKPNTDGTFFRAYRIADLPAEFVKDRRYPALRRAA